MHMGHIEELGKTDNKKTEASVKLLQGEETEASEKNGSWEIDV